MIKNNNVKITMIVYFLLIYPVKKVNIINNGKNNNAMTLFTLDLIEPLGFIENIKLILSGKKENSNRLTDIVINNIKIQYFKNFVLFIF